MLTCGVCLLQDNARPHTARVTCSLVGNGILRIADPNLVIFHLFQLLKKHLAGKISMTMSSRRDSKIIAAYCYG